MINRTLEEIELFEKYNKRMAEIEIILKSNFDKETLTEEEVARASELKNEYNKMREWFLKTE